MGQPLRGVAGAEDDPGGVGGKGMGEIRENLLKQRCLCLSAVRVVPYFRIHAQFYHLFLL